MEDRKTRLMKKALKMYGVDEEKQNSFIEDLTKLDAEEPQDEQEKVGEQDAEEQPVQDKVQEEEETTPIEPTNDSEEDATKVEEKGKEKTTQTNGEDKKVEDIVDQNKEPQVVQPTINYEDKFKAQDSVIQAQNAKIDKLTEMIGALGISVDGNQNIDSDNPFGNQMVEPMKRDNIDDDGSDLERKLGGRKY